MKFYHFDATKLDLLSEVTGVKFKSCIIHDDGNVADIVDSAEKLNKYDVKNIKTGALVEIPSNSPKGQHVVYPDSIIIVDDAGNVSIEHPAPLGFVGLKHSVTEVE